MEYVTKKTIDIDKDEITEIKAIEHDTKTRFINFKFIGSNKVIDLSNCKVRIYAKNSKYQEVFNDLAIVDSRRGIAKLELTDGLLRLGTTEYQLKIMPVNGGQLSSNIMRIIVDKNLMADNAIESSNEYTALENAINEVDLLIKTGNDTNKSLVDNISTGTNLKTGLDSSITNANNSKKTLDVSISTGTTLNTDLSHLNTTGQNTKNELNAAISRGDLDQIKKNLQPLTALLNANKFITNDNMTMTNTGYGTKTYIEIPFATQTLQIEFGIYNTTSGGGVKMAHIKQIIWANCSVSATNPFKSSCYVDSDPSILRFTHDYSSALNVFWIALGVK